MRSRSRQVLPFQKHDAFTEIREIKMPAMQLRVGAFSAALALLAATSSGALAQKKYDTGASDTEIKIGNIMPYSGPASAYGVIGKTEAAYFKKINDAGGINGRKINFVTYDDAYSPPKTVEQARKLVESDEVLFVFNSLGTPSNSAIQKYMNAKKVPQLFVATGATDTEIKIGNIMPYSGPASAYGIIGKTEAAYFKKINDAGGINGRKINFISYDDAYSPPKTVEQARKLVESDEVLLIFNPLGTPPDRKAHV